MERYSFKTIAAEAQAELKVKGSRFLAYVYPVSDAVEADSKLKALRQEFPDATHHCYAYRLGIEGELERSNDDGEPSNSAGRPILRQLFSKEVTNVLAVVIRYYGGTKLGVGGLIDAYGSAAQEALAASIVEEQELKRRIEVEYDYADEGLVFRLLNQLGCEAKEINRREKGQVIFYVPLSKIGELKELVAAYYSLEVKYDEEN